jgi:hypothetical protein
VDSINHQDGGAPEDATMKVGLTIFPTDYSMQSPDLAIEAEERDFESIWLPAVATTTARPLLDTSAERFSWRIQV